MNHSHSRLAITTCALLLASTISAGETKLIDPEGEADDWFGRTVAIDGNVLVVGAFMDDVGGAVDAGSATIYRWNGSSWVREEKLTQGSPSGGDNYSSSVDVSGDAVVVGNWRREVSGNPDEGSVTWYKWNGSAWQTQEQLFSFDGGDHANFGHALSVDGDFLLVGAPRGGALSQGVVEFFLSDGSSFLSEDLLFHPASEADDRFGTSVSVKGDRLIVGAHFDDVGANNNQGSAQTYQWLGFAWAWTGELHSGAPVAGGLFGQSVSTDGTKVAVGEAGAVTVFSWNGSAWIEEQRLSGGAGELFYGRSVAIDGDRLAVGVYGDTLGTGTSIGSVVTYAWNGASWSFVSKLTASSGAAEDRFGWEVALDGNVVATGADHETVGLNDDQGAAYVFGNPTIVAAETDLDLGETVTLEPGNDGGDETEDAAVTVTNSSGSDDSEVTVEEGIEAPEGSGFGVVGVALSIETSMEDGEFVMSVTLPVTLESLGGANPVLVDLAYFDVVSGQWELAVAGNTVNSPGHTSVFGDRFVVTDTVLPSPAVPSDDIGDYGVFWNSATQKGFVWANVDHTTDFSAGLQGMVPYGCGLNPATSLAPLAGGPKLGTTLSVGLDDPVGASPPGSVALLLASIAPDPSFPCGTPIPGYGMAGPTGELLVGVVPPNPVAVLGPVAWAGPGLPAPIDIPIPNDASLLTLDLFLQGVMASVGSAKLTDALQVTIGN